MTEASRITGILDDGNCLHGGPHEGLPGWEGKEGAYVAVDADRCQHQLEHGSSWYPHRPPFAIYRNFKYGVADDPARPGVWRFWTEWHYVGSRLTPWPEA